MPVIRYEFDEVTDDFLAKLELEKLTAPIEKRYAISRGEIYYRNLRRWRRQGYHFFYTGPKEAMECTCGLVVAKEGEGLPAMRIPLFVADRIADEFKPDGVQSYLGHQNLPGGRGLTTAILTKFKWSKSDGDYRWGGFCQICGEFILDALNSEAREFESDHNGRCKVGLKLALSLAEEVINFSI